MLHDVTNLNFYSVVKSEQSTKNHVFFNKLFEINYVNSKKISPAKGQVISLSVRTIYRWWNIK